MKLIIYDAEVFTYDWIAVFKDAATGEFAVFHNESDDLRKCFADAQEGTIFIGFNSKHYDRYIMQAVCGGLEPEDVKAVSDFIIAGGQGWKCPLLDGIYFKFNNADVRDDMQPELSLKAIEGHLGMDIRETEVDFDLDRPLTRDELNKTIEYCKHDVNAAHVLVKLRRDYLATKLNIGRRAGIGAAAALSATNAKLTAMMLHAERQERDDGRNYVYPKNLDTSVIPKPILDFFDTIHDESIPDDELFKTSLEIELGGMPCTYAWGGVHGSLTGYYEHSDNGNLGNGRRIQNRDVSSLYPSLIEKYNYLSRNVPDPELFYAIRRDRIEAKRKGDKQTAKDLKLPLNTVSGAQENRFNDLYDPLPTRSLRISGQLFLTALAMRLINACRTIRLLNLNTDGLMYSVDESELHIVDKLCAEWERETGFELETDDIERVWIKDVNNLLIVKCGGAVKTVGGYLNYGISEKGAWAINNNAVIVKKALTEYFVNGVPPETTINSCDDISEFQFIAKAGSKYRGAYRIVDGEPVAVQKVNRVFAAKDVLLGTLYKIKQADGSTAKIENLPEHCMIGNANEVPIGSVDKQYYIDLAYKRIAEFMGEKPKKQTTKTITKTTDKPRRKKEMATANSTAVKANGTAKKANIYERLMAVRDEFAAVGIEKNGKNMQLTSKFFTLDDIVNVSRPIFHANRLLPIDGFTKEEATLSLIDLDDPSSSIDFSIPMREYMGNSAVTPVQAMGATVTYYRRYLYSLALDLAEKDELEEGFAHAVPTPTHSAPPATAEQRETVKRELTAPEGRASDLQIKQLKAALQKFRKACPEQEEMVEKIAIQTKAFTEISKTDCEKLLTGISKLLEEKRAENE